jgi:hypothetical protein
MRRREFLRRAGLAGGVMVFAAGCGGGSSDQAAPQTSSSTLDADLEQVDWPAFVTQAGGDVRELYEFQLTHGELMQYMPCFCGCGRTDGHHSNRDCFVQHVNADGSAVLDDMAPT